MLIKNGQIPKIGNMILLGFLKINLKSFKNTLIITEQQKYNIIPYICKYITIFHNIHEDEIELSLFTNNLIDMLN
jgi:hypothetical protein